MIIALGAFFLAAHMAEPLDTSTPTVSSEILYTTAGTFFESISLMAKVGEKITEAPKEFHLLSDVTHKIADHFFTYALQSPFPLQYNPPSHLSWTNYHKLLSQIPAPMPEDKQLLSFLTHRWLAKSVGFSSIFVDWICPCFGIFLQVHPETTSSYARSPFIHLSKTYTKNVESWKYNLPQPQNFPLILTRPSNLNLYLPEHTTLSLHEPIEASLKKLAGSSSLQILDMTPLFSAEEKDPQKWQKTWGSFALDISKACQKHKIPLSSVCCIQKIEQKNIGGIRILPLPLSCKQEENEKHLTLLKQLSIFGLSANRIELDRNLPLQEFSQSTKIPSVSYNKEKLLSYLDSFPLDLQIDSSPKKLMLQATLQILKGLLVSTSEETWQKVLTSSTRSALVQLSFCEIQKHIKHLQKEEENLSFFEVACIIEQIHGHLCALLEVYSPCNFENFSKNYKNLFSFLPSSLLPLASCGIHSSGMNNLTGIIKAVELSLGSSPHVVYGENTYYEAINALEITGCKAKPISQSTEKDLQETNLVITQFNPVWKGTNLEIKEYKTENVEEVLCKMLAARNGKPFTVALDCTIDFLQSNQVEHLAKTFEKEIQKGLFNLICYRSGLKFDLFGMDHFCGAPFIMIHNQDKKWDAFDLLTKDLALQTDKLSLNWFSLAYTYASKELDLYRAQIFHLTRQLLNKAASQSPHAAYRILPCASNAHPAFIDITVTGAWHRLKTSLIAAYLTLECLEEKLPLFYRISFGLYHTNLTVLYGEECSTIRLTLGLDPKQIQVLSKCFDTINALNESD